MTRPLFLLAHGAGAGQSHPTMTAWRDRLATLGPVHPFEYDYMGRPGRRPPERLPRLIEQHRAAYTAATARWPDAPVVLIGKSMGSRVGCHLANALDVGAVTALVCLGYPLKGARALRDEVLVALRTPVLFVQGTRDPLCPLDLLARVRQTMTGAPSTLHVVEGGDHSLTLRMRDLRDLGGTQADRDEDAFRAVADFVADRLAP